MAQSTRRPRNCLQCGKPMQWKPQYPGLVDLVLDNEWFKHQGVGGWGCVLCDLALESSTPISITPAIARVRKRPRKKEHFVSEAVRKERRGEPFGKVVGVKKGDVVAQSHLGPGVITEITRAGFPKVNDVAVSWVILDNGYIFDPKGVKPREGIMKLGKHILRPTLPQDNDMAMALMHARYTMHSANIANIIAAGLQGNRGDSAVRDAIDLYAEVSGCSMTDHTIPTIPTINATEDIEPVNEVA